MMIPQKPWAVCLVHLFHNGYHHQHCQPARPGMYAQVAQPQADVPPDEPLTPSGKCPQIVQKPPLIRRQSRGNLDTAV